MNVALNGRFLSAVPTGVQRFALGITRELVDRARVTLMLPRGVPLPPELADSFAAVQRGTLTSHAWEQVELPKMVRRAGADVTLHLANALPLGGAPHALVLHDATVFEHPEWFSPRYALWHRKVLLPRAKRAAAVGAPSRSAAGKVAKLLGRRPDEVATIPQGIAPMDHPAALDAVGEVRARFGIHGAYVLAIGSGDPRKNVAFLESVMARWARDAGSAPTLVLAGGVAERVFAQGAGDNLTAGIPRVVRTGRVDDETLRALYTGASAFAFPSLDEGFGRPPLEALACGAPAVVAPYDAAHEALGDAARILPLDVDAWVDALRQLVDGGAGEGFAQRAQTAVTRHRWEDGAKAVLELCERAARSEGVNAKPMRITGESRTEREPIADNRAEREPVSHTRVDREAASDKRTEREPPSHSDSAGAAAP